VWSILEENARTVVTRTTRIFINSIFKVFFEKFFKRRAPNEREKFVDQEKTETHFDMVHQKISELEKSYKQEM